jgi:hypothetical protein
MRASYKGFKIDVNESHDPDLYIVGMITGMDGNPDPPPLDLFIEMSCVGRGEYSGYLRKNDPDLKIMTDDPEKKQ